jgi:hypothetical protein
MIVEQLDNEYKFIQIIEDDGSCRVLKPSCDVNNESDEVKKLAKKWTKKIKDSWLIELEELQNPVSEEESEESEEESEEEESEEESDE